MFSSIKYKVKYKKYEGIEYEIKSIVSWTDTRNIYGNWK